MTDAPQQQPTGATGEIEIFLVANEESGDRLGAALMRALGRRADRPLRFSGVGGGQMAAAGLSSLLPMEDFSVIGFTALPARLPRVLHHLVRTLRAVLARRPDVLVVIDSPGYTLRLARLVRRFAPHIPIVKYVSPSVWAWRPGRARAMRHFVDHVLALLPFEPAVHRKLGGPPCTYVGHPLIEEAQKLRPDQAEATRRAADPPLIVTMPGSRSGEIARLAEIFGQALGLVRDRIGPIEVVVPTVPHLHDRVVEATRSWPVGPRIAPDAAAKHAAFRRARAALAKSGTTTLELAVSGVPMVAAYKVAPLEAFVIKRLVQVPSYILANLVLGENVVPQIVQHDCTPERLADALCPLIDDTPQRRQQIEAFARLDSIMEIGSREPAARAAEIVLDLVRSRAGRP